MMAAGRICREEFRLKNFLYRYHDETAFYRCMWRWPRPVFLCIRVTLAVYMLYGFVHELVHYYAIARNPDADRNLTAAATRDGTGDGYDVGFDTFTTNSTPPGLWVYLESTSKPRPHFDQWDSRRPWYVFFTLWSYMVLLLHLVLAAVLSGVFHGDVGGEQDYVLRRKASNAAAAAAKIGGHSYSDAALAIDSDGDVESVASGSQQPVDVLTPLTDAPARPMAWYLQLSWLLSDVITPCAPLVTVVFFTALYRGGPVDVYDTNVHVLNTVFVCLDQLVSARPVRLLHAHAPVLFAAIYALFSFVFWTSDHVNHVVYKGVIDWNEPMMALLNSAGLVFVAIPMMQCVWFLLYRFKVWLYGRIYIV